MKWQQIVMMPSGGEVNEHGAVRHSMKFDNTDCYIHINNISKPTTYIYMESGHRRVCIRSDLKHFLFLAP